MTEPRVRSLAQRVKLVLAWPDEGRHRSIFLAHPLLNSTLTCIATSLLTRRLHHALRATTLPLPTYFLALGVPCGVATAAASVVLVQPTILQVPDCPQCRLVPRAESMGLMVTQGRMLNLPGEVPNHSRCTYPSILHQCGVNVASVLTTSFIGAPLLARNARRYTVGTMFVDTLRFFVTLPYSRRVAVLLLLGAYVSTVAAIDAATSVMYRADKDEEKERRVMHLEDSLSSVFVGVHERLDRRRV